MIDTHPHKGLVRANTEDGRLEVILDLMTAHLMAQGHSESSIRRYILVAAHFGHWLQSAGLELDAADADTVDTFRFAHLQRCDCPKPTGSRGHEARAALRHLLVVLHENGCTPAGGCTRNRPWDDLVSQFADFLDRVCGVAPNTRVYRVRYVRKFLNRVFGDGPAVLAELGPEPYLAFIREQSPRVSPGTIHVITGALRSFLRFVEFAGLADTAALRHLPGPPRWKLGALPSVLDECQIEKLLAVFDLEKPNGLRDRAMVECMLLLGLRAAEVAELRLSDIDWRQGTVWVRADKERRACQLPLAQGVAKALEAYLTRGRPQTEDRHVFVRHTMLRRRSIDVGTVRRAIYRAFALAGLELRWAGPHTLRRTAATRMLRGGATMKEIADILRHRTLETTAIYAKVDVDRLTAAALPWPEVHP